DILMRIEAFTSGMIVRIGNEQAFGLGGVEQFRVGGDERDIGQSGGESFAVKVKRNGKLHGVVAAQKIFTRQKLSVLQHGGSEFQVQIFGSQVVLQICKNRVHRCRRKAARPAG